MSTERPYESPVKFSDRYGNVLNPPSHLLPPAETPLPNYLEESRENIDTSFDRKDVIDNNEIPSVIPALAGLRLAIANRRINSRQSRIERLSGRHGVLRHVGRSAVTGENYLDPEHPLRPNNMPQRIATYWIDTMLTHKQKADRKAGKLGMAYPDIVGSRQTGKLFYDQYDPRTKRLSWGERRNLGKAARRHRRSLRAANRYDRAVEFIAGHPSNKVSSLKEKRDKLVVKAEALEQQKGANILNRRQRAYMARRNADASWRFTKRASRKTADTAIDAGWQTAYATSYLGGEMAKITKKSAAKAKVGAKIAANQLASTSKGIGSKLTNSARKTARKAKERIDSKRKKNK